MWFFRAVPSRKNTRLMQFSMRSTATSLSIIVLTILLTGCGSGSHTSLPPVTPLPVTSGTRLLFDTAALSGNVFTPGIDTIAPDGSNLQRVINDSSGGEPRFSPDGSKIIYVAGSGISYVAIANADGSFVASFSLPSGQVSFPAFRPDGKALVFVGSNGGLYTSNVDGSQLRQIVAPTVGTLSHPTYTPDGTHIVYALTPPVTANETPRVHIINADGSKDSAIAADFSFTPTVSPDGKRIAFAGFSNVNSTPGIFLINMDGTGAVTQIIKANASNPVFSPDGTKIAFLKLLDSSAYINGTPTYEIHIVNVDGTGEARVGTKLAVGTSTLDWR